MGRLEADRHASRPRTGAPTPPRTTRSTPSPRTTRLRRASTSRRPAGRCSACAPAISSTTSTTRASTGATATSTRPRRSAIRRPPPVPAAARSTPTSPRTTRSTAERGPHLSIQLDSTLYFDGAGRHQLKAGAQFDRIGLDGLFGRPGTDPALLGPGFCGQQGPFGYYRLTSNDVFPNLGAITQGEATRTTWGSSSRTPGRSAEADPPPGPSDGERARAVPADDPGPPSTAIHFGFGDKLAPRLGFAWDATGDGKTKLYGSWGVFYDITKLG